ncbi:MAG: nuclear transport factor 2 family protein [Deltaproteobacteria bacterium]|nr:nuclear transport factor 2 family protein [Deltaproteobacteria bacterium]
MNDREKEVRETLKALNRAWTEGRPEELSKYFHKDMVAITATDRKRLEGRDACVASWTAFANSVKITRWKEIDPRIDMYGETAVVTYYFDIAFESNGRTMEIGGRDMFVFVKEAGRWWAVADQFSPYPG